MLYNKAGITLMPSLTLD